MTPQIINRTFLIVLSRRFAFRLFLAPALVGLLGLAGCRNKPGAELPADLPESPAAVIKSSGNIGLGGTVSAAFGRAGVRSSEAFAAQETLRPLHSLRAVRPQHRYEIYTSTDGALLRFDFYPDEFDYYRIERSTDRSRGPRGFIGTRLHAASRGERAAARGEVRSSLWEAMTDQGVPADVIWKFADIFGWRVDFLTEPRVGDRFRLIWQRDRNDRAIRDGDILYAAYHSLAQNREIFAFELRHDYFDQDGRSLRGQFLRAPLSFRRISSRFNPRRRHPILRIRRPHHGTDYAAPTGTPVQAIADGRITRVGWDGGLGKAVRLRHMGRYASIYGHLSRFARGLRAGKSVRQGQTIGYVGATGLSSGPHLHFEFRVGGRPVDFLTQRFDNTSRKVAPSLAAEFEKVRQAGLEELEKIPPALKGTAVLAAEQ